MVLHYPMANDVPDHLGTKSALECFESPIAKTNGNSANVSLGERRSDCLPGAHLTGG